MKHIGTKLSERLARGDKGVNGLDEFCKEHDIAYETNKDSSERYKADKKLSSGAMKRLFSKDASFGERAASLLVSAAMKAKTNLSKFGMGLGCGRKNKKNKKTISFNSLVQDARREIKRSKANNFGDAIKAALRTAKKSAKGKRIKVPRIIKVPSISGGILPILPILAGLGAIGSLVGSATGVLKTVKDMKNATAQLEENKRHNQAMERKVGSGLYLGTFKKGKGLYLRPFPKQGKGLYLKPHQKSGDGVYLKPFPKNLR